MNDSVGNHSRDILIQAVDVEKTFHTLKDPLKVLAKTSMDVKAGEILGIVGASGVGKSTLLHILGGLDKPTEGEVLFQGRSIYKGKNASLEKFRNVNIGFVFQFFNLLPEFTVFENTLFPALIGDINRAESERYAYELLEQVGLKDRLQHKPGELSGGETQRVALARALINCPQLILADEPTGNLDSHSADALLDLIKTLNRERKQTFVMVTHSQRLAQNLDRVLQLVDGNVRPIDKELII